MKKLTLDIEQSFSWFALGISCQLADYKFVFRINKQMKVAFQREENFNLEVGKIKGSFSLYRYFDEVNQAEFFLLSNRDKAKQLFAEYKQLDYFLLLRDEGDKQALLSFKETIRKIDEVLFLQELDISNVKNYYTIAHQFEVHIEKINS